jgi:hypothetical protein
MPRVYIHLNDESSKILLEKKGILSRKDRETATINKSKICTNCSETNRPYTKWCMNCKMVLSYTAYTETLQKQQEKEDELKLLKQSIAKQQEVIDRYDQIQQEGRILSIEQSRQISEINRKVEELFSVRVKERKLNREYESIPFEDDDSLKLKDEKFNQMLKTTRQKIRKQVELERDLQGLETNNKKIRLG